MSQKEKMSFAQGRNGDTSALAKLICFGYLAKFSGMLGVKKLEEYAGEKSVSALLALMRANQERKRNQTVSVINTIHNGTHVILEDENHTILTRKV